MMAHKIDPRLWEEWKKFSEESGISASAMLELSMRAMNGHIWDGF